MSVDSTIFVKKNLTELNFFCRILGLMLRRLTGGSLLLRPHRRRRRKWRRSRRFRFRHGFREVGLPRFFLSRHDLHAAGVEASLAARLARGPLVAAVGACEEVPGAVG
jgi:hypothetical protein